MKKAEGLLNGILVTALLTVACGGPSSTKEASATGHGGESAAAAAPGSPPAPALAQPSSNSGGNSTPLEILSVLSVEHEVDVLAERDGVVQEITEDSGARVEKGAVLARLDDREALAKLDRAKADLEVAQQNVKYNEAEVKARAAAYRRANDMHKLGLKSDADLEEAEFKAKGAQYDTESWRAVVERNRAEIRMLELDLEKTRVRAPFGGVVARRYISGGQNVMREEKCFRLSQLSPLEVRFLVPETAGRPPRLGEAVTVVPLSDGQRTYLARIQRVSPTVDAASGSYDVMAQLNGSNLGDLRPGMSVRVLWKR